MNHRPDEDKWLDTIRDSMAGYETRVPDGVWDEVSRRIPASRRHIMPLWLRRAAVAAMIAGAIATALLIIPSAPQMPDVDRMADNMPTAREVEQPTAKPDAAIARNSEQNEQQTDAAARRQPAAQPTPETMATDHEEQALTVASVVTTTESEAEKEPVSAAAEPATPPLPAPAKRSRRDNRNYAAAARSGVRRTSSPIIDDRFDMGLSTTGALFASTGNNRSAGMPEIIPSPWGKSRVTTLGSSGSWSADDGNADQPDEDYGISGNQGGTDHSGKPGPSGEPDDPGHEPEGALAPGGHPGINSPIQNLKVPGHETPVDYDHPVKARHHQPVKVGMSVSYRLTPRLSLESGLTYTCLSSDLEFLPESKYSGASRSLHYLGIPVGVRYRFASWSKLDFYGSASFLTELCVGGRYKKFVKPTTADAPESVTTNFREHRPQLSANAALGAQWSITPGVGIYAEPGIGYYFDNGSRVATLYKDHSLNFNINVGFRLTLNN